MTTSSSIITMILSGRQPSHEDIAALAFEIYQKSGRPEGREQEHWRRAEEELMRQTRLNQLAFNRPSPF